MRRIPPPPLLPGSPSPLSCHLTFCYCVSEIHRTYLNNYVRHVFGDIVRVFTNPGSEPYGAIRGRSVGIRAARGEVIVELDAHEEVQEKWLEPLLHAISQNKRIMASVTIEWMKPQDDGKCYNRMDEASR